LQRLGRDRVELVIDDAAFERGGKTRCLRRSAAGWRNDRLLDAMPDAPSPWALPQLWPRA